MERRSYKNYLIPIVLTILLGVLTVYAGSNYISNSPSAYYRADNLTINNSGINYNSNKVLFYFDVCKSITSSDDLNLIFDCKYICGFYDNNCTDEFANAIGNGNVIVNTRRGTYPNVSIIMYENTSIIGEGSGKQSYSTTRLLGDGINPVIKLQYQYANANADLTHNIEIRDMAIYGNNARNVIELTNPDILRIYNCNIAYGMTCINLNYSGITPPTSSTIPGGFWILDNILLCNTTGINVYRQTQGWIENNWFPSGSASSEAHIVFNMSNKVRVSGNEFNDVISGGCGIYFEDGNTPTHNLIITGNWHSESSGKAFCFSNTFGRNSSSKNIKIDDLLASETYVNFDEPPRNLSGITMQFNNQFYGNITFNDRVSFEEISNIAVNGTVDLNNGKNIRWKNSSGYLHNILKLDTDNNVKINAPGSQSIQLMIGGSSYILIGTANVDIAKGNLLMHNDTSIQFKNSSSSVYNFVTSYNNNTIKMCFNAACTQYLFHNGTCIRSGGSGSTGNCL